MYRHFHFFLLAAFSLFCLAHPVHADELDDRVREIAHNLRCTTCQAMSVKESDAGLSLNMKQKIREMLESGKSEAEILDFFEERYGEWILRSPKKKGFNLLLWGFPGVVILAAVFLWFGAMRKRAYQAQSDPSRKLTDEEKKQIENDLNRINQ